MIIKIEEIIYFLIIFLRFLLFTRFSFTMSLSRKTYSPMNHSSSYSSTMSPSYSYSRVTSYLDALQKDETINKLKRQITNVKSLEMRYHAILQEIQIAEKDNRILENKNTNVEQEFVQKIQQARADTNVLQTQLQQMSQGLSEQGKKAQCVEGEIQSLLDELRELKLEEESFQQQNVRLESEIGSCNNHIIKLQKEKEQLTSRKTVFLKDSKQSASCMQNSLRKVTQLNETIAKYEQELGILQNQSQCFSLQSQNMSALCSRNITFIQNLQRKVTIQQGENQQLKAQLDSYQQQWKRQQDKFVNDKESLYQNVIQVQEQSLLLKDTLGQLDRQLEKDSTEKKYLKDISTKYALLQGQNQQMRELLRHLQQAYMEKKAQETFLLEEVNKKLRSDELLKSNIEHRTSQLNKIKQSIIA